MKLMALILSGCAAIVLAGNLAAADAQKNLKLTLDRKDGIYRTGDEVRIAISYAGEKQKPMQIVMTGSDGSSKKYDFPKVQDQFAAKIQSSAVTFTVLVYFNADRKPIQKNGKSIAGETASIGAVADPEKIRPGFQEPADFQQFWDAALAELAKVPVKAKRKEVDVPKNVQGKFQCWDVQVDCAGGVPVSGYLTMPVKAVPKSLPAVVSYHGAGVYSSWKSFTGGAIHFNINAHGIENGREKEFYRKLAKTELADYRSRNAADRDKFYFRNMFLRVKRSLDYVKTLPEYDGRTLIVTGSSQGGAQAIAAAGLDPDVVLMQACVPAMCDHGGGLAGRMAGWPKLLKIRDGKIRNPELEKSLPYYDMAFFARRIRGEAFFTVGLIDRTCCPDSVFAAFNLIPGRKTIWTMPDQGHVGYSSPVFTRRRQELIRQAGRKADPAK